MNDPKESCTKQSTRSRDQSATRDLLIKAVGTLLARQGFTALGVNAVAKEAGVDKVLIYRYFGGLPELLRAFGESGNFWPTMSEVIGADIDSFRQQGLGDGIGDLLVNFSRALRRRPLTLEIMAWEMVEQNELTTVLAELRETWATRLFATFREQLAVTDLDIPALTALFGAAINYLAVRGRNTPVFNLVEIDREEGWQRLEATMRTLCSRCFN